MYGYFSCISRSVNGLYMAAKFRSSSFDAEIYSKHAYTIIFCDFVLKMFELTLDIFISNSSESFISLSARERLAPNMTATSTMYS